MKHKNYPHMFHAVDWMPTLMEMLSCKLPKDHLPLDGVSHMKTILGMTDRAPREEMLLHIDPEEVLRIKNSYAASVQTGFLNLDDNL